MTDDRGVVAVTLLVPAFNEEAVLGRFLDEAIPTLLPGWELLLVDDGSSDGTYCIASAAALRVESVRVVRHAENRGLGAALATGFRAARGSVIVTIDSDLSHPLDLVPVILGELEHADVVYASRYVRGGAMVGLPRHRALISEIANRVLRVLFATQIHDLTTGFRAYRRSHVADLDLRSTGFAAQLELTVRLQARGCQMAEVPLVLHDRVAGASKMRYLQLIPRYGAVTVWLLWLRWRPGG